MFVIRKNPCFNDKFEKEYQKHIEKKCKYYDDNFLRMFKNDNFHDGLLKEIKHNVFKNNLFIKMSCPNFVNISKNYINVDYDITFSGISLLKYELDTKLKQEIPHFNLKKSYFLQAELGTIIANNTQKSIIMKFVTPIPCSLFYITIIFNSSQIAPSNPILFEQLQKREKIYLEY